MYTTFYEIYENDPEAPVVKAFEQYMTYGRRVPLTPDMVKWYSDTTPLASFYKILADSTRRQAFAPKPLLKKVPYVVPDTRNLFTDIGYMLEFRTKQRIESGEYKPVPAKFRKAERTGVHISTTDDNLLAYYPTDRHIIEDRAQQIKPGKYLQKYFGDEMSADEIRCMAALCKPVSLEFYSDWKSMYRAYRDLDKSGVVSSCMSKDGWGDVHPLMVYHESDVMLAVLYKDGEAISRALFNKHTRQYPMVYGNWEVMQVALENAGFTHGPLDGAKIRRLDRDPLGDPLETGTSSELLMPYIDDERELDRSSPRSTRVDVYTGHCVINSSGAFDANDHEHVTLRLEDDYEDCDCCGESVPESELRLVDRPMRDRVCPGCYDHNTVTVYRVGGDSMLTTEDWAQDNANYIEGTYYYDSDAAAEDGWVYSEYHEDWRQIDDCVWVGYLDSYVSTRRTDLYVLDENGEAIEPVEETENETE